MEIPIHNADDEEILQYKREQCLLDLKTLLNKLRQFGEAPGA